MFIKHQGEVNYDSKSERECGELVDKGEEVEEEGGGAIVIDRDVKESDKGEDWCVRKVYSAVGVIETGSNED